MNKSNVNENNSEEKIITKYDMKIQRRKEEAAKEARNRKVFLAAVIAVLLGAIIGTSVGLWMNYQSIHGEYIQVGEESVDKIEFDYYYNTSVNNFVSTYSSYLSYFGLDTSKSFAEQDYSEDLTWYDYFAQMGAEALKESKAMVADAKANNFDYSVDEDYAEFKSQFSEAAGQQGVSIKEYYKNVFGNNATEKNLESTIKEYLTATAYYTHLTETMAPSDDEINTRYDSDTSAYDYFDYRLFTITAEDVENADSVAAAKLDADTFLSNTSDDKSFAQQCVQYAKTDDDKSKYADENASLNEKARLSSMNSLVADWMKSEDRVEGDKTVVADEENGTYYVVYFVNRYFDEEVNDEISETITGEKVEEYITALTDKITITDKDNNLKYLTIEETTGEEASTTAN